MVNINIPNEMQNVNFRSHNSHTQESSFTVLEVCYCKSAENRNFVQECVMNKANVDFASNRNFYSTICAYSKEIVAVE